MPYGFEILRARTKDSAVLLIDRLMRSKQREVVLVLPKNSIISADLNSLKILKEEAESVGKILSLSTENDEIRLFADKIKMPIYDPDNSRKMENAAMAKNTKKIKVMFDILPPLIDQSIKEINEGVFEKDDNEKVPEFLEPEIYEAESKNSDLEKNIENFYSGDSEDIKDILPESENQPPRSFLNRLIIFFVAGGLLLFGFAMYLILPKVELKISLKEIPLKVQIPVAVSKSVNSLNLVSGIIPGQYFLLSKEGSKTIKASPRIGGIIEIYNAYSAAPQKLVAQTRFETKDGKIFRIQNPIVIPGAKISGAKLIPSSISAKVFADTAGDEYLIGPSFFTISGFKETPKYAGFYAKSAESMAIVENISISAEELERNKNELKDRLAQELKSETLSTLKDSDLQLIDGASATKINDFKVNSNILSMKITWQALFFKERDLRSLIDYFVSSHYPDLKKFTFEDNIAYPKASRFDIEKGQIFFSFVIDKNNALPVDLGSLKKELSGHDENGMRTIISDKTYINSAVISLWPFWVRKAPNNLNKINITIDSQ